MKFLALIFLLVFAIGSTATAADKPTLSTSIPLGGDVGKLEFKDIRFLNRTLSDFGEKSAYVFVFTTCRCPLVAKYIPELNRLEAEYRSKNVQFVAINVGLDDSINDIAAQAVRHRAEFPFVKDLNGAIARKLGVERTPTAVVLNTNKKLSYRGRINDQYRVTGDQPKASRNDLKLAIEDVLAARTVSVPETQVDGCLITLSEVKQTTKAVTYTKDVLPLLQKHCQDCHHPKAEAPFALMTYEDARAQAKMIGEVVRDKRMPPWFASAEQAHLVNHRGMSSDECETIEQWIEGGMVRGDPAQAPPARTFPDLKWVMGEPDLVISALEVHTLPADGIVDYKYVVLPKIFMEDTWVQGVEIMPDNPRVVHHCNMGYVELGGKYRDANFVTGRVPGGVPMTLKDGVAFCFPKASLIGLQCHYVTTGKPEKCRLSVGIRFARGTIEKRLRLAQVYTTKFVIPPLAPAHEVRTSRILPCDADALGAFTHMHMRGRDMEFLAHLPNGKTESILLIPNYNYDWQMAYRWSPGQLILPKGTKLECIAHYDNSTFNPYNPDPKATVRHGLQTTEEMMYGFFFYTDANEKLGLNVDPKTGLALKAPIAKK